MLINTASWNMTSELGTTVLHVNDEYFSSSTLTEASAEGSQGFVT